MESRAFTIKDDKILNCLITACGVCKAFIPQATMEPPILKSYSALWDTGATNSVIDKQVAEDLGLIPSGISRVYNANGSAIVNRYLVNLILPNNFMIHMVPVTEGILNGTDMLIGMDIIGLGDFVITHKNKGTVFSFQMPSTHEYDFVKQIQHNRDQQKHKRKK